MIGAVNSILSILIMIGIGYILAKKGWFSEETSHIFTKMVINISLPALMVTNITLRFNKEILLESSSGILLAFGGILLSYFIALIISNIAKLGESKKALFCAMFAFSNTIFVGLPVNIAIFGEESITYVLLYYIANTSLFWSLGVSQIKKAKDKNQEERFNLRLFRKIFSPPFLGFLVGITLVMLKINMPSFLFRSLQYIGNLTTPLSMFFIGIVIFSIDFSEIKFNYYYLFIIIGRFIITPMLFYIILRLFNYPIIMKRVFVIEAGMPIITQVAIVSKFYEVDSKYTTTLVASTTVISILFIPIFTLIPF